MTDAHDSELIQVCVSLSLGAITLNRLHIHQLARLTGDARCSDIIYTAVKEDKLLVSVVCISFPCTAGPPNPRWKSEFKNLFIHNHV